MRVSIITATYNHEKYIAKCIESVLRQTYTDWEQIVVDDGSTDGTEPIVRKYAKKDNRIKYIKKNHEGIMNLKNAYNLGVENASGDLIAILEGDDYWPDNKLQLQIPYFEDENVILTWGKVAEVDINGNLIRIRPHEMYIKNDDIESKKLIIYGNYILAVTVIIRNSALIKVGGFQQYPNLNCVDTPTLISLMPLGKFKYIPNHILGYWVKHHDNVSIKYKYNLGPIYNSSFYYYKKLPKEFRKLLAPNDFIMWMELKKRFIKQVLYNFRKKYNLFLISRNDD